MADKTEQITKGCEALVYNCALVRPDDVVLIVSDTSTAGLGALLLEVVEGVSGNAEHVVIEASGMHGVEPPESVAEGMRAAHVVFGLTKMSMAHTRARKEAMANGARYLSLPDYSEDVLASPALQVDFRGITPLARSIAEILDSGDTVRITTDLGTDLSMSIRGRSANCCPAWCDGPGTMASPPDAETNVAPLEDSANGIVIVDGSIPCREIGLLDAPIAIRIEDGVIVALNGPKADVLDDVLGALGTRATRVLAELGIGLNPMATLCGAMLEDEGCKGTVHLGFGSNATIGGVNEVPFHLDMILRRPTLVVDGYEVISGGIFAGFLEEG